MPKQADEIQRIEPDDENNLGYEKRGKPDKGNVVAIDAAENEGLPVVGLGDEKPRLPGKAEVVVIKSAASKSAASKDLSSSRGLGKNMRPTIADIPEKDPTDAPLYFTTIPGAEIDAFIRARAYQLYEQGCKQEGHAEEHWRQAQSEILSSSATTRVRM
jgi:hypothetical protein